MWLHLIRHAHAVDGADDAVRPLSAKGRRQVRRLASFLRRGGLLDTREIWHSPLVRARATAELLAERSGGAWKLREIAGLEPGADPALLARRLASMRRPVALVGHEPHLSALATRLLTGRAGPPVVVMRKAAVLALERTGRHWAVRWLVSPGEL